MTVLSYPRCSLEAGIAGHITIVYQSDERGGVKEGRREGGGGQREEREELSSHRPRVSILV